jgi:mono/diheme cytochrome c family protein
LAEKSSLSVIAACFEAALPGGTTVLSPNPPRSASAELPLGVGPTAGLLSASPFLRYDADMRSAPAVLLMAVLLALGAAACGGDDGGGDAGSPPPAEETTETDTGDQGGGGEEASGADVFASAGCGGCHTLEAAGSSGATGPNLDELDLTVERVVDQVTNGGGGMPAFGDRLSDAEIQAVAEFVVSGSG